MEFFNQNAGGFQAIFSILLFWATVIYVIINSRMHKEMVKTRERSETPELCLRLKKISTGFYSLVLENISDNPAYDLHFFKAPSLQIAENITTVDIGFIKNGIKYLAPKQSYESYFLNYCNLKDQLQTLEFEFEYRNKQKNGKVFRQIININLSLLFNRADLGKTFEEQVINELKGIKESIASLGNKK